MLLKAKLILSILLLLLMKASCQSHCERNHCNWTFFELKSMVKGKIIAYELGANNYGHSRGVPTVSMVIVQLGKDSIRVLSTLLEADFEAGTTINIFPSTSEKYYNFPHWVVGEPIKKTAGWRKRQRAQIAKLPTRFDALIKRTTWGILSSKSDCERTKLYTLLPNSYPCSWAFFELKQPLRGRIIAHHKQQAPCDILEQASLSIVAIGTDTIRVLDFCNGSEFNPGDEVKIEYQEAPSSVQIPSSKNLPFKTQKTTWGSIRPIQKEEND